MEVGLFQRLLRVVLAAAHILVIQVACGAVAPAAVAADSVIDPQLPTWADTPLALPPPRPAAAASSSPIRMLVLEQQVDVASSAHFVHVAMRIESEAGLQSAGQIAVNFASTYQQLHWHYLRIWRAGEKREALTPTAVQVLRQEQDAERFMYHGYLSALVILHDLRVGDVVEYAYTRVGENPVFEGRFSSILAAASSSPIDQLKYRVLEPAGRTLHVGAVGKSALVYKVEQTRAGAEHLWLGHDIAAIHVLSDAPSSEFQVPFVEMSEFESWADVAAWGTRIFGDPPASPLQKEILESVLQGAVTRTEKANAVLRFVQDEVRYLGVELGESSHRPEAPDEVLRRRFGDCKDKSLLLVSLLRQLGFKADIALVHSDWRGNIDQLLPSPLAFDHVITRVEVPTEQTHSGEAKTLTFAATSPEQIYRTPERPNSLPIRTRSGRVTMEFIRDNTDPLGGTAVVSGTATAATNEDIWIDGTAVLQGGSFSEHYRGDFGKALVLTPGAQTLRSVPPLPDRFNDVQIHENYGATNVEQPGQLEVTTVYRGAAADSSRYAHRYTDPAENLRHLTGYLARYYPKVRSTGPQEWTDDRAKNMITVRSHFEVPEIWTVDSTGKNRVLEVAAWPVLERLPRPETVERTVAFALPHPQSVTDEIELHLPKAWPWKPEQQVIEDANSRFEIKSSQAGSTIYATYRWWTKTRAVPADQIGAWTRNMADVRSSLGVTLRQNIRLADEVKQSGIVLPLLMTAIAAVLVGATIAVLFMRRRRSDEPPPLVDGNLHGISGWLILVAIHVTLRPFLLVSAAMPDLKLIGNHARWVTCTDSDSGGYLPTFASLVSAELFMYVMLLAWSVGIIFQFFGKRATLPRSLVLYLITFAAWSVGHEIWFGASGLEPPEARIPDVVTVGQAVIFALIWCSYLLKSRRVKNTFVN